MNLAGSEFFESVHYHAKSWLPARSIVLECIQTRRDIDPSGEIMVLNRFCPWKLHLFELEDELKIDPPIKYAIYQETSVVEGNGPLTGQIISTTIGGKNGEADEGASLPEILLKSLITVALPDNPFVIN